MQVIPLVYFITGTFGVELWQFSLLPGLTCSDAFRYGIYGRGREGVREGEREGEGERGRGRGGRRERKEYLRNKELHLKLTQNSSAISSIFLSIICYQLL